MTKPEQHQIRQLLQTPQWQTAEKLAELIINKIRDESPVRETTDQTAVATLLQEGEIRGIRRLIQELYQQASQ